MVQGVSQFRRRMKAIPQNVRAEVAKQLEKEAEKVVREMKVIAPRGASLELMNSIGWTWGDAPAGTMTVGRVAGREFGQMAITIYAGGGDAFYARFQEFGTRRMPANPFFYPTWRANKRRVRGNLTRAIKRGARKS